MQAVVGEDTGPRGQAFSVMEDKPTTETKPSAQTPTTAEILLIFVQTIRITLRRGGLEALIK